MNTMDRGNIERPFPSFPQLKLAIVINLDHLRSLMCEFLNEMETRGHTTTFGPESLTDWKFEAFLQWARRRQEDTNAKKSTN
jgi:hypothetical protein